MSIDNEAYNGVIDEKVADKVEQKAVNDMAQGIAEDTTSAGGLNIDLSFLLAKTGDGAIEDYINHPLNFTQSKGLAQVLRGATGMLGALDLAVIDIGIGTLNMIRERKGAGYEDTVRE